MKSRKSRISTSKTAANRKSQRRSLPIFEGLDGRTLMSVSFGPNVDYAVAAGARSVAVGDFNSDGRKDLVSASYATANLSVLLGNGNGTFQSPVNYPSGTGAATSVAVGDFNADGRQDLAAVTTMEVGAFVLLGNGNGTFQSGIYQQIGIGSTFVTAGDVNGDGRSDLVTTNDGKISVLLSNGNGTSQPAVQYIVGAQPDSISIADFNGDSRQDLAVANQGGTVSVLLGNGNGTFQTATSYAAGTTPFDIVAKDLNGDGRVDLVTANLDSNNVSVLLGNGNGTFQPAVSYATGQLASAITAADFDLDGKPDLAITNSNPSVVSILPGVGNGAFQPPSTFSSQGSAFSVATADFNGDARPDLVYAAAANTIGVLLNTTVLNAPPTITRTLAAVSVNEGSLATNTGTFDDPQGRSTVTLAASLGTVTKNDATGTWSWSYTPTDQTAASVPVTITATDTLGASATATFTLAASNVAPTITGFNVPASATEGGSTMLVATATDPAGANDPLTFTWTVTRPDASVATLVGSSVAFPFGDNGNYAVSLAVTDGDGGTATRTASIAVANVAPTILTYTVAATGNEGTPVAFSAQAFDPAGGSDPLVYTWTITKPDASTSTVTGASGNFIPADQGNYSVVLKVTDGDGGQIIRPASTVVVSNVAPTINTFILAPTGFEGSALNFSAGATDPAGANDPLTYTWTVTRPGGTTTTLTGATPSFTPTDNGTHGVSLTVSDGDGGNTVRTGSVAITNVAPTINTFTVPTTGTEGTVVSLTAAATDPAGANDPLTYAWTVTRPNGSTTTLTGTNPSLVLTDNGSHGVSLTVSDGDGGSATRNASITVSNVAPTINTFTVPTTGNEGSALNLSAVATDPAGPFDPLSYSWTITRPDGTSTTLVGANQTIIPVDNGTFSVGLIVSDGDGGTATRSASIVVANVAPTATFSGPNSGSPNQTLSFTASATDPSSVDESRGFEYRINWGDGTPLQVIPRTAGNASGVSVTHAYATAGTYNATLTAIDQNGGASSAAAHTVSIVGAMTGDFLVNASKPSVAITFPINVLASSIAPGDLTLVNTTTSQSINTATLSTVTYDAVTRTATWKFGGLLADGNYRATLPAGSVNDSTGSPIMTAYSFDFFVMAGDANRDRSVDIGDFSIIAARFNLPGTFSQGDFNYDGIADIGDFAILASKFNTSLPAARAVPAAGSSGTDLTNLPPASAPDIVLGLDAIEDVDERTALVQ